MTIRYVLAGIALAMPACFVASDLSAQERVTESRGGVSVTLPADEADLADEMLKIAKVWHEAFQKGLISKAFEGYVLNPKAAENSRRRVADHLGIENEAGRNRIAQDWKETEELARRVVEGVVQWERGFDSFHFWTKAEAESFRQRDRFVFQDTRTLVRDDGAGFRVWPGFFPEPIDLDAFPDPQSVPPYRLDMVLAYRLGSTPGQIARQYHDLLNPSHTDGKKGVVSQTASPTFDAMYRRVFEKALDRRVIRGEDGKFFREALSFAFTGNVNNQLDPERGSKILYGERLRRIANHESETEIASLTERIRKTGPWPSDSDGFAETATREIALAMVFSSLKNAGNSLDGWLRDQGEPLDARAFSERLDTAAGDDGWETMFGNYCNSLADQFAEAFPDRKSAYPDPGLSAIEQGWPRVNSGRIEVVHPPDLAQTALLISERIDKLLDSYLGVPGETEIPRLSETHYRWLRERGIAIPQESPDGWTELLRRASMGGISHLRVRLWIAEDAVAAIKSGATIPGFSFDPETEEITISQTIGIQRVHRDGTDSHQSNWENPVSWLIIPFSREQVKTPSPSVHAEVIENHCRVNLDELFERFRARDSDEERFFLIASYALGEYLIQNVITSEDREWFVIGLSHWIAMQLTDLEFGPGAGRRVFESRWPPQYNEPRRDEIDLVKWVSPTDTREDPLSAQNVYFATLAIHSALKEKDAAFLKQWIEEIRKTPYQRTHLGTVIRAYQSIGAGDLRNHVQKAPRLPPSVDGSK